MSVPNILVVDSDEGFGLMLKEGLESSGFYNAHWVQSAGDALRLLTQANFDLIIIDVALTDASPLALVQGAREVKSEIKVMLIPLMGQNLPQKMTELDIDGILTKPFFVGDLPDLVDEALDIERAPAPPPAASPPPSEEPAADIAEAPAPAEAASAPTAPAFQAIAVPQEVVSFLRSNETEILRLLDDLNREVRAEAILLIAGAEMISQAGMLSREQCHKLAMLVAQSSQAAAQAANFLGEQEGRFAQSLHEGDAYRLYTLTLSEGILLSLALSSNVPLGMIRHQCRQIAERLSRFIG